MKTDKSELLLDIKGVVKNFGGLRALDSVDLKIHSKQIVGLIGPNGSGKTTLFNSITGVYIPDSGRITFAGSDITTLSPFRTSRLGIGRTFQQINLFGTATLLDNVVAGMLISRTGKFSNWMKGYEGYYPEAMEYLKFVGLEEKSAYMGGELPYGDQRRLELARALASKPKLLLLDEPLAGMNPVEIEDFLKLIKKIHENGTSILFIEHNVRAVMGTCELIYVFNYGKKIAEGCPEDILKNQEVIKAYLGEDIPETTVKDLVQDELKLIEGNQPC